MSDKVQFPIVENGYDVASTDAYIAMLQDEYGRVCSWGQSLEKRLSEVESGDVKSDEIEKLRAQNSSLYNNCIVFAKYIKSLEKLRNEQSKFIDAELSVAENRKSALEQEIVAIEEKKRILEENNNVAGNQADEIIRGANARAEEKISEANAQAALLIQNANVRADEILRDANNRVEEKISAANIDAVQTVQNANAKADEILRDANARADEIVTLANSEAVQVIQNAKNRADELLKEWMDKMSVICSEIDNLAPKSE